MLVRPVGWNYDKGSSPPPPPEWIVAPPLDAGATCIQASSQGSSLYNV